MKYKIEIDDNNYLLSLTHTGTSEDTIELEPSTMNLQYIKCYKLNGNTIIFDDDKYNETIAKEEIEIELATLHKNLGDSDYLVSRTFEQVMALENPLTFVSDLIKITKEFREKYAETIANRETWRKRIEELENK